jgi:lactate dehydrogenase-like 2-hydroxyacid dehydrogenase
VSSIPDAKSVESLEELMQISDVVSLHVPGHIENHHLINAEMFKLMKPTAYLVNTARGDVVDEAALIAALNDKLIAGAGLDVFENEPSVPAELMAMENVSLLPHIGSATLETRVAMGMRAVDNLVAFFEGKPAPDQVI